MFPRKQKYLPENKTISLTSSLHKYPIFTLCSALPVILQIKMKQTVIVLCMSSSRGESSNTELQIYKALETFKVTKQKSQSNFYTSSFGTSCQHFVDHPKFGNFHFNTFLIKYLDRVIRVSSISHRVWSTNELVYLFFYFQ